MLETDAPYLSPAPHRKVKPNHPALLVHTARFLAEMRSIDRALKVHKLVVMPFGDDISVNLELDCYVRKTI